MSTSKVPTREIERLLMTLIEETHDDFLEEFIGQEITVRTYEEVGMMTNDCGLVIKLKDGSEFALTIQRRK